ncbi:MAG: serine hydroxymethyltransferase, partial [Alphaproteobacteria bacterium]
GYSIVSGGTDNHLLLVDLRSKNLTGKASEASLERAGLTCNKNAVPFDQLSPFVTSGIRIGTPAGTTRGFGEAEFKEIGSLIAQVLDGLISNPEDNSVIENQVLKQSYALCQKFPIYSSR